MTRMEVSSVIKASPEKVWEMLAWDRAIEWMEGMEWVKVEYISEVNTPEDKYRVGTIAHITEKHGEYDFEVIESLENERFTARSRGMHGGKATMTLTQILKPVDGGTKLTFVGVVEMPWEILGKAIGGLARRAGERDSKKALEKLKNILEK